MTVGALNLSKIELVSQKKRGGNSTNKADVIGSRKDGLFPWL